MKSETTKEKTKQVKDIAETGPEQRTYLFMYVRKLRNSRQTDTLSIGCEGVQEVFFIWTT